MPIGEMAAQVLDAPRRLADPSIGSLASGDRLGGVMRIGRTIFIPVILALGAAGTTLAVSAAPAMAWHAPTVHAHVIALSDGYASHYHCWADAKSDLTAVQMHPVNDIFTAW